MENAESTETNSGCLAGFMSAVYAYTTKFPLFSNKNYPYKGFEEPCRHDSVKGHKYSVAGWEMAKTGDSLRIKSLLQKGPLVAEISASQARFKFYSKGILNDQKLIDLGYNDHCAAGKINHAVLIVGWGRSDDEFGDEYFIVKNSFGSSWGEGGFARLSTKASATLPYGTCNILLAATIAV